MTEPRIEIPDNKVIHIEVITPCEHGYDLAHAGLSDRSEAIKRGVPDCPGGSRLVYTREEAAAKFVEWGDELVMDDALVLVDVLLGVGE